MTPAMSGSRKFPSDAAAAAAAEAVPHPTLYEVDSRRLSSLIGVARLDRSVVSRPRRLSARRTAAYDRIPGSRA